MQSHALSYGYFHNTHTQTLIPRCAWLALGQQCATWFLFQLSTLTPSDWTCPNCDIQTESIISQQMSTQFNSEGLLTKVYIRKQDWTFRSCLDGNFRPVKDYVRHYDRKHDLYPTLPRRLYIHTPNQILTTVL